MQKAEAIADERAKALEVRAAWMREMGFSQEEIDEACADNNTLVSLREEEDNLRAAIELKEITPPISVLESWAVKRQL